MLKRHNQILLTFLFFFDLLLAYATWELAFFLRFYWINLPVVTLAIPSHYPYVQAIPVLLVLTGVIFFSTGVYHSQRISKFASEFNHLLKACGWLLLLLVAIGFFYRNFSYSRVHVLYFMSVYFCSLLIVRLIIPHLLNILHQRGLHTQSIAIIGSSEMIVNFAKTLHNFKHLGMILKGYIRFSEKPTSGLEHLHCLGDIKEIEKIVKSHNIDQVFIALSNEEKKDLSSLYDALFDQLVDIKIIPDLGAFKQMHIDVEKFEDIPIVTIIQSTMVGWNAVIKRILDFLGSLTALILFSPFMLIISVAIKLTSPGPIFYRQERMGLDGVTFQAIKFRSMKTGAEQETGAVWAKEDDDRRTSFGVLLRKTSLDELPQFINILKGEMSIVGPRPERPVFINDFKKKIPNYMLRHKVKAGLTGWAQINGWRGNTSLEKRIEYDLYYIEHWSIWLDLKILILTPFKGFVDPNAY